MRMWQLVASALILSSVSGYPRIDLIGIDQHENLWYDDELFDYAFLNSKSEEASKTDDPLMQNTASCVDRPVLREKPADYEHFPGIGIYKLHTRGLPWFEAQKACCAEGGQLAFINSQAQDNVLYEMFNKHHSMFTGTANWDQAIIGFYDPKHNGEWETVEGQHLAKDDSKWFPGKPDGSNEFCGSMLYIPRGGLNDFSCSKPATFFCEIPESILGDAVLSNERRTEEPQILSVEKGGKDSKEEDEEQGSELKNDASGSIEENEQLRDSSQEAKKLDNIEEETLKALRVEMNKSYETKEQTKFSEESHEYSEEPSESTVESNDINSEEKKPGNMNEESGQENQLFRSREHQESIEESEGNDSQEQNKRTENENLLEMKVDMMNELLERKMNEMSQNMAIIAEEQKQLSRNLERSEQNYRMLKDELDSMRENMASSNTDVKIETQEPISTLYLYGDEYGSNLVRGYSMSPMSIRIEPGASALHIINHVENAVHHLDKNEAVLVFCGSHSVADFRDADVIVEKLKQLTFLTNSQIYVGFVPPIERITSVESMYDRISVYKYMINKLENIRGLTSLKLYEILEDQYSKSGFFTPKVIKKIGEHIDEVVKEHFSKSSCMKGNQQMQESEENPEIEEETSQPGLKLIKVIML